MSDVLDPGIKYGSGQEFLQAFLDKSSSLGAALELQEKLVTTAIAQLGSQLEKIGRIVSEMKDDVTRARIHRETFYLPDEFSVELSQLSHMLVLWET